MTNNNWDIKRKTKTTTKLRLKRHMVNQDLNRSLTMRSFRSLPPFLIPEYTFWKLASVVKWRQIPFITCKSQIFVSYTLRKATAETSWENSFLRYIYLSMHIYIYSSPFHLATAQSLWSQCWLIGRDLGLSIMWYGCGFYYQQTVLKMFSGPEDRVLWLWD